MFEHGWFYVFVALYGWWIIFKKTTQTQVGKDAWKQAGKSILSQIFKR